MRNTAGVFGCASLAVLVWGCSGLSNPPPFSQPTPAKPAPTVSVVSGIVVEGSRPIEGAQVENSNGIDRSVTTDANGAFQLPPGNMRWVRAIKDGYIQACTAPINGDAPVTVQMVSQAALPGAPLPSPSGLRTVSGVILQMTSTGPQPVAGVWVDFEPVEDWPAAQTYTDNSGRFSLYGLPLVALQINAFGTDGFAYTTVTPGQTEIELTLHQ